MARDSGKKVQEIATNTKETTRTTKNGDTVNSHGKVATSTRAIMKETYVVDMERCTGSMAVFTKENGSMECSMVKVTLSLFRGNIHSLVWVQTGHLLE